ncbi:glycosyltransferase family protein, partial [Camelimonas abortus]
MNLPLRVVIVVTHLLGVGHLARAGTLARAMAARGHQVRLVTGGQPVPLSAAGGPIARAGVEIVQLPPVHVTGTAFSDLRQADGAPLDAAAAGARIAMATQAVRDFAPHVLVTELFPFGRRALGEEFLAVIAAARALPQPPLALASVRDILARPSQQAKIDAAHARLRQFYDGVLVHSDPAVARLEASWPLAPDLQPLLHYTGYVDAPGAAAAPAPAGARAGVVVSGGGSEAALPLLRAALQAAALDAGRRWRLLAGHKIPETDFGALQAAAPANVTVERARPDFRALLAGCAVSVSQFGYNTALDLLASGAPAVVVPFAEGGETEQAARAALFAARGRVTVLAQEALTPPALLAAVNEAATRPAPQAADIAVDGATRTARIIEMLAARRAPAVARLAAPMRAALRPAAEALARAADAGAPVAF